MIDTERDLVRREGFLAPLGILWHSPFFPLTGKIRRPICPFLVMVSSELKVSLGRNTGKALRIPGDVGGLAKGTELIECAPRLCKCVAEYGADRGGSDSGDRVFVKVIVTEKGSPAK